MTETQPTAKCNRCGAVVPRQAGDVWHECGKKSQRVIVTHSGDPEIDRLLTETLNYQRANRHENLIRRLEEGAKGLGELIDWIRQGQP